MPFPTVPIAPGVPPLVRLPGATIFLPELMTFDLLDLSFFDGGQQWGIFLDGQPVIEPDSIREFGFRNSSSVSDYQQEKGAFESYNKVANPFDARVVMTQGGSAESRAAILEQIDAISRTLDLYDVVTPEKVYPSVNVVHYDYQRSAHNGVGLLKIDVFLREIRETGTAEFTQTQDPSGASPQNGGAPQTQNPSAPQTNAAAAVTVTTTGGTRPPAAR